jgi:hypothetical protein
MNELDSGSQRNVPKILSVNRITVPYCCLITLRIIGGDAKESLRDEQMCSGRYRDEFGQPLNDAKEEGVEEGHNSLCSFSVK